jgi:hypothetical protein
MAKTIRVRAGISRLVTLAVTRYMTPPRWAEPIAVADRMLTEAGVRVEFFDERLDKTLMFDGEARSV